MLTQPQATLISRLHALCFLAAAAALAAVACESKPLDSRDPDGNMSPACPEISGQWRLETTLDFSACGEETDGGTETWTIEQTGCRVALSPERDVVLEGTISGNDIHFAGSWSDGSETWSGSGTGRIEGGALSLSASITVSDGEEECRGQLTSSGTRVGGGNTGSGGASGGSGGSGAVVDGVPASLDALAVGLYAQSGSTCDTGTRSSGLALFLCPGGRLRGAGMQGNLTELMCGSYTTAPATYENCTDRVGCFPKVNANVRHTLTLSGQTDVDPNFQFQMLLTGGARGPDLMRPTACNDDSSGYVILERQLGEADAETCVSAACPASSGSSGSDYGTCRSDCDCGRCWYCESGTCRYGGEGPYGCYRGCSG